MPWYGVVPLVHRCRSINSALLAATYERTLFLPAGKISIAGLKDLAVSTVQAQPILFRICDSADAYN